MKKTKTKSETRTSLRLASETLRTLGHDTLTIVASGCPTGSWPTQTAVIDGGGTCAGQG